MLSNNFGCNIRHILLVCGWSSRFCIGWMSKTIWCCHWRISTTYWMFSWVSSYISCSMNISISLCMSTTFFLMKNSLEIGRKFTTFIHFWIQYSIVSMRNLMLNSILIHDLRWLMRIVLILYSFQFIKSFVKLNISELLFNSSMSILCHTSTISLSCSCTRTILTSNISTS